MSIIPFHTLHLELTTDCNARCEHCYLSGNLDNQVFIEKELALKAIDEFYKLKGFRVQLTGGEPLLHPDILEIIAHARRKRFAVFLSTNGTLITDNFLSIIEKLGAVKITFSIYSCKSEKHDSFVGIKGALDKIIKNTRYISQSRGLSAKWNVILMNFNWMDIEGIIGLAGELNVETSITANISPTRDGDRKPLEFVVTRENIYKYYNLPKIKDYYLNSYTKKQEILGGDEPKKLKDRELICNAGFGEIAVLSDGSVTPCLSLANWKLGNVAGQTLKEIYSSSPLLEELRALKNSDFPECINCKYVSMCPHCIGMNEMFTGDIKKPGKEFCEMIKNNYEAAEAAGLIPSQVIDDSNC